MRERFLHNGEDPAVALAPGSPRRRALDEALAELAANPKAANPSTAWRREFSLLLGLERVLSEDEPKLADGTVLSTHQVDALSGTLAALLAAAQTGAPNGNGRAAASASPELLATAEIFGADEDAPPEASADANGHSDAEAGDDEDDDEDVDEDDDEDDDDLGPVQLAAPDEDDDEDDEDDDEDELGDDEDDEVEEETADEAEEEPRDWADEDAEEELVDQPEDPNAAKRFWFEHATGAGKT
ncbi:MAG TPA: hypothetical protein VHS26_02145, partial [Solirubrobacteraceae bacterium]|nr:hypothetical protein [Solirubrobacteraceae bacterium]